MLTKLKKKNLSLKQKQQHNFCLGFLGESQASSYLLNFNYSILETNVVIKNYEIDIIALDRDNNELVFFEVKTRDSDYSGEPSLAVSRKKLNSLKMAIFYYLELENLNLDYRIDIISIVGNKIKHLKNISWLY